MTGSDVSEKVDAEATSTTEAGTKTQTAPSTPAAPAKPETAAAPETKPVKPADSTTPPVIEKPQVPETYEFKTKEGKALVGPVVDAVTAMAKQHGWSQETASQQLALLSNAVGATRDAESKNWEAALKAHPTIGGDKLQQNLAVIAKAREAFSSPDLNRFLDETRLGNHPLVAELFFKMGQAISPDGFTAGVKMLGRPGQLANPGDTSATAIGEVFFGGAGKK